MEELIFVVEEAREGGYTARALGGSNFTEADTVEQLHEEVRDAVRCHFDDGGRSGRSPRCQREVRDAVRCHFEDGMAPQIIRLHFVHDEVLSA